jgi:TrmH family RNA methyltransferase
VRVHELAIIRWRIKVNTKSAQKLVELFRAARRDRQLVVLEGLHALKHAHRFGAVVHQVVSWDAPAAQELAAQLAPDLGSFLKSQLQSLPAELFRQLAPVAPPTGLLAIADRPSADPAILQQTLSRPIVLLDDPRRYGNIGAAIRVAAAAAAAAVVVVGEHDPWHPEAVRGAAGLQFALPVLQISRLPSLAAPLVAIDPEGELLATAKLPAGAVLAFGSERTGLSAPIRQAATHAVRIPMAPGVSSLNLATAVAIMLYAAPFSANFKP